MPLSNPRLPDPLELPPQAELAGQMHLIHRDGRIWRGADAVAQLAFLLPETRIWGMLLSWPVIRHLARPVYRLVAANRHRLGRLMQGEREVNRDRVDY